MTITNGSLSGRWPVFRKRTFALLMAFGMNKLYVKPINRIVSSPMMCFVFVIKRLFAPITKSRRPNLVRSNRKKSYGSGSFLERISGRVNCALDSELQFYFWLKECAS